MNNLFVINKSVTSNGLCLLVVKEGQTPPPFAIEENGKWYADFRECVITKMTLFPQYGDAVKISPERAKVEGFYPNHSSNGDFFFRFTTPCGQEWRASGGCSPSSHYEVWMGIHPGNC